MSCAGRIHERPAFSFSGLRKSLTRKEPIKVNDVFRTRCSTSYQRVYARLRRGEFVVYDEKSILTALCGPMRACGEFHQVAY
ncbi:MAG: hypothetical protein OJF62_002382 [Pseudolabrys sp.]|nr:hypothetical protein [Pseudolabrys sp.]